MFTPVFVDLEISTKADEAQSPRVSVPIPNDPYEAIRQAYLVKIETPESPHIVASPTLLPESAPPTLVPFLCRTTRMVMHVPHVMSPSLSASIAEDEEEEDEDEEIEESLDSYSENKGAEDEGPTAKDEDPATRDKGLAIGDEGPGTRVDSLGLGRDAVVPEGQQWAAPVVEQPWTSPSPEWSSGSLLVSSVPFIVPSPISSPMIPLIVPSPVALPLTAKTEGFLTDLGARVEIQGGLIRDHT
nr:hypothetical protein [Tanacetum cinerariifolium]